MLEEFELIRGLIHASAAGMAADPRVRVGPGDDLAVLNVGDRALLAGVDQVLDGVHFSLAALRRDEADPLYWVARKAVNRNLSDVAAMAAVPLAVLAAVSLPRAMPPGDAARLSEALDQVAGAGPFPCRCVGGDISVWDGPLTLSVTVLATADGVEPVLRTGAEPGDRLYVTGTLGDTLRTGHHLRFEPRLEVARRLASDAATRPTAMLDLSDGLAGDLAHLTDHAVIHAERLPLRGAADWRAAVSDGEDHELLLAVPAGASMPPSVAGVPLTCVGEVRDGGGLGVVADGAEMTFQAAGVAGWSHGGGGRGEARS